jgi:hypothetical protein
MSIAFDACCFTVPLMMPLAVEFSVCRGVAGWLWPISVRVVRSTLASFALRKRAPTSASAAEDMTLRSILAIFRMGSFGVGLG